jgi:hypothetical protein
LDIPVFNGFRFTSRAREASLRAQTAAERAQLQQTQAQIAGAQAGYDYRLSIAILQYETTGI